MTLPLLKELHDGSQQQNEARVALALAAVRRVLRAHSHPRDHAAYSDDATLLDRIHQPADLPERPSELMPIIEPLFETLYAGYCNVSHPAYLGYISPKPLFETLLGDFMASGLNQTPGAWRAGPAATAIEFETLHWLREFVGLEPAPEGSPGGIVTTGGTMANLTALKLARDRLFPQGIHDGMGICRPVVYVSDEGHFSILKAADMLGLGRGSVRHIEADSAGRIRVDRLSEAIAQDQREGRTPLCVIGVAGTSATGAIDPLNELADVAARHGAWFHVDGAAGVALAGLPELKRDFVGLERADSVTLDPCKWLFAAFGIGCLFLRDTDALRRSFDVIGHYWEDLREPEFFRMSFNGTRQWRSLGLWLAFRAHGRSGYQRMQRQMLACASHLDERLSSHSDFEVLEKTSMPICCFRPKPFLGHSASSLTRAYQRRVNETGNAYLTLLDWRGELYLRAAFNNHDCTVPDVDVLVDLLHDELQTMKVNTYRNESGAAA